MRLIDLGITPEPLFEGVTTTPATLAKALANANDMNMGFEVEFMLHSELIEWDEIDKNNIEEYIPLGELLPGEIAELVVIQGENPAFREFKNALEGDIRERQHEDLEYGDDWYYDYLEEKGIDPDDEDAPDKDEVEDILRDKIDNDDIPNSKLSDEIESLLDDDGTGMKIRLILDWIRVDPASFGDRFGSELNYAGWEATEDGLSRTFDEDADLSYELEQVAEELVDHMNLDEDDVVVFETAKEKDKDLTKWYVEPDATAGGMVEISSPVKPVPESLESLNEIFNFIDSNRYKTTEKTGLHVSLSFKKKPAKKPNWVKLALLIGEKHIMKKFDRYGNSFTKSQRNAIENNIRNQSDIDFRDILSADKIHELISDEKHSSFSTTEYNDTGRVEFRMAGNTRYERMYDEVKKSVGRYVLFLKVATTDQYQKEYLKKLGGIFLAGKYDPIADRINDPDYRKRVLKDRFGAKIMAKKVAGSEKGIIAKIKPIGNKFGITNEELEEKFGEVFTRVGRDSKEEEAKRITEYVQSLAFLIGGKMYEAASKGKGALAKIIFEKGKKEVRALMKEINKVYQGKLDFDLPGGRGTNRMIYDVQYGSITGHSKRLKSIGLMHLIMFPKYDDKSPFDEKD